MLSIGTVLPLAPAGPALARLQAPVNGERRREHFELVARHVHLIDLQTKEPKKVVIF